MLERVGVRYIVGESRRKIYIIRESRSIRDIVRESRSKIDR